MSLDAKISACCAEASTSMAQSVAASSICTHTHTHARACTDGHGHGSAGDGARAVRFGQTVRQTDRQSDRQTQAAYHGGGGRGHGRSLDVLQWEIITPKNRPGRDKGDARQEKGRQGDQRQGGREQAGLRTTQPNHRAPRTAGVAPQKRKDAVVAAGADFSVSRGNLQSSAETGCPHARKHGPCKSGRRVRVPILRHARSALSHVRPRQPPASRLPRVILRREEDNGKEERSSCICLLLDLRPDPHASKRTAATASSKGGSLHAGRLGPTSQGAARHEARG
jgi:hypothetical protein